MDIMQALAEGLAKNPAAWLLASSLVALAYLYRDRASLQKEYIDTVMKQEAAHRETLLRIAPLAEKLAASIDALEKMSDIFMRTKP
jgi:hypothetical protein